MRWDASQESSNVEDRRGVGMPVVAGGGIGALVLAAVVYLLGGDPSALLQSAQQQAPAQATAPGQPRADDEQAAFAKAVLGQTEQVWTRVFAERGMQYSPPTMVLYDGATQTGCGVGQAAMGPFYCPNDQRVYLDLSFFREMQDKLGAPGDFARAYVIAHEVGHHVQNLLGEMGRSGRGAEGGSVRTELQADCYAGVWENHAQTQLNNLEPGDIEEGLNAASAVGDDRLQQESRGYVSPDSFTHGTSAQRTRWFTRGYKSGRLEDCDTFDAQTL